MDPAKGKVIMSKDEFINKWTGYILTFEPYKKLLILKDSKQLNKLIYEVLMKNKKMVLNILILSIIFTAISCIGTYYFQIVIDHVIDTTYSNLIVITLIFIFFMLYKVLTDYFRNELLIYLNQKLDLTLIINTFNKILLLPYNYYKNKTTGEMISRINDIVHIRNAISKLIITVFLDLLICVVGGIILYNISNKLFIFLIVITLVYILVLMLFKNLFKRLSDINQVNNAKINSFLVYLVFTII